jgi:hypothetical protein
MATIVARKMSYDWGTYAPDQHWMYAGADWPYNEVGKIPRGPSSSGAPSIMTLFFFKISLICDLTTNFWAP